MKKILSLVGIFALSGIISGNLTACHKDTETNNIDQEIANVLTNMKDVKDIDKTEDGWQFVNETFFKWSYYSPFIRKIRGEMNGWKIWKKLLQKLA